MSKIIKQDTNGTKALLGVGEFGYDNYPTGGDAGRVYVGDGSSNIPLAKKVEMLNVDGKVDTHVARIDNPHSVTKTQVGLGSVDNTSDIDKPISTAVQTALGTKQNTLVSGTNIKTIEGQSIVGSGNIDLSKADVGLSNVDNTADSNKVVASAAKWTTGRLINGSAIDGTIDVTTSKWGTSRNITIGNTLKAIDGSSDVVWSLAEIGAIGVDSPSLTGVPTAPTAAVDTNTTQIATTAFVNAEIANDAIPRVIGIDTAIVKFNGTSGTVQTSGIRIDSNDNIVMPKLAGGTTTLTMTNGVGNTTLTLPESGTVATQSYVDNRKNISYKLTPVTVTSWSYLGTTVTLNVASHTFVAGDYIKTNGLTSTTNPANGIFTVTSTTLNTIVFTAKYLPTGTAGVSSATASGYATINGRTNESIGENQVWAGVSAVTGVTYYNTSGRSKMVMGQVTAAGAGTMDISITSRGVLISRSTLYAPAAGYIVTVEGLIPAGTLSEPTPYVFTVLSGIFSLASELV